MIKVYINYPNSYITIHKNLNCEIIQCQNKNNQRYIFINANTISIELLNFINRIYGFGSTPKKNDMWIEIDFQDQDFELSIIYYVHRLISNYYSPFSKISPKIHCEEKLTQQTNSHSIKRNKTKYWPLYQYLLNIPIEHSDITLSFNQIERIINDDLPMSAHKHAAWWANEKNGVHVSAKAWMKAGWVVDAIDQNKKWVRFCRK